MLQIPRATPKLTRLIGALRCQSTQRLHPFLLQKAQQYSLEKSQLDEFLEEGNTLDTDKQKRYARVSRIAELLQHYKEQMENVRALKEMAITDPALKEDVEKELEELNPEVDRVAQNLLHKLLPPHVFADKKCLIEVRPGVGGVEAMIFAKDLLDMYTKYAQAKRWKYHLLAENKNEAGSGILEGILSIDEDGAYDRLRLEAGVHRVQRIPSTETKGRTHTSTAGVIVLPQMGSDSAKDSDVYERSFKPDEIRIDVMRARGKGGQHVNTTDSAVRLTHFPSGIVISMQDERSQHKNKAKAFAILRAKLAERERIEKEKADRQARKDQVTTTDRSDKIRTYNYPQNRVTDHRCNFTIYNIAGVANGEKLDEVIDAVQEHDTAERAKHLLIEAQPFFNRTCT